MTNRNKALATFSYFLIGGVLMLIGDWLCLYALTAGRMLFGLGGAIALLPIAYFASKVSRPRHQKPTMTIVSRKTPSVKKSLRNHAYEQQQAQERQEVARKVQLLEEREQSRSRKGRQETNKPV